MMSFYYVATPYSKYPAGTDAAYRDACVQTSYLIKAGIPAFSPIAHSHGIAVHGRMDLQDHSIWLPADAPFMHSARGIIVVKMESWDASYGISEEIKYFVSAGKPVIYMEPGHVPDALLSAAP